MRIPRIEIYLDHQSNLCIAKVERPDSESRIILDFELEEIKALDPEDAAYRVGGTILNLLRIWNKEKFGEWEAPPIEG